MKNLYRTQKKAKKPHISGFRAKKNDKTFVSVLPSVYGAEGGT